MVSDGKREMFAPLCDRHADGPGWRPCRRLRGHAGPCAHESRLTGEVVARDNDAADALDKFREAARDDIDADVERALLPVIDALRLELAALQVEHAGCGDALGHLAAATKERDQALAALDETCIVGPTCCDANGFEGMHSPGCAIAIVYATLEAVRLRFMDRRQVEQSIGSRMGAILAAGGVNGIDAAIDEVRQTLRVFDSAPDCEGAVCGWQPTCRCAQDLQGLQVEHAACGDALGHLAAAVKERDQAIAREEAGKFWRAKAAERLEQVDALRVAARDVLDSLPSFSPATHRGVDYAIEVEDFAAGPCARLRALVGDT